MNARLIPEFIAQIRDNPEDDNTRLVLSDLYEELGDVDRATLIRKQVERARHPSWSVEALRLGLEERALLATHGERWRADLPQHEGVRWGDFRRGLIDRIAFEHVGAMVEHAAECAAAAPISGVMMSWPRLGNRAELGPIEGLRALTIVGTLLNDDDMHWLVESPLFSTVHTLELVGSRMNARALHILLKSPQVQKLRALRMPLHDFGTEGVELLTSISLPALEDLDLSVETLDELGSGGRDEPTMDQSAARALGAWGSLAQVRTLNLSGNQVGRDGLAAIISSKHLRALKTLRIRGVSDFDWEGDGERPEVLPALADAAPGLQLDELDIAELDLDEVLAEVLTNTHALSELKVLSLDYVNGQNGVAPLLHAPWFDGLRVLSANDFGNIDFIETLVRRSPKALHSLRLGSTYYWSRVGGLTRALAAGVLPSLLSLELNDIGEDDQTLIDLGQVASFPSLLELRIVGEDKLSFSEDALSIFAASPLHRRLLSFEIGHDKFDRLPRSAPFSIVGPDLRGPYRLR